jgi:glycosyltransferase involved in cell wall biosynthesis
MRVALIIQRYGPEVLGGSESLARQYAHCLNDCCDLEVLTTCALDHLTWRNHFPAGVTDVEGVRVRRFATDFERGDYWWDLWEVVHGGLDQAAFPDAPLLKRAHRRRTAGLPRALQEETVRRQGPYSSALQEHLARHGESYDALLFFTYLYPTTHFGMQAVPCERVVFCPTLHDEPLAYLPIFGRSFRRARSFVFLSEAERQLARRLYATEGAEAVVGMYLEPPAAAGRPPAGTPARYVLYAGRIEGAKGMACLFDCFLSYKERYPSDLKLVLIGTLGDPLPQHPDVVYLGFVGEAEKHALMRGARAFVHPSPYESFSIVLLESFQAGTPALVNRHNAVLLEHAEASGAGLGYGSAEEFGHALARVLADPALRQEMGERGRRYVAEWYRADVIRRKLLRVIEAVAAGGGRPAPPPAATAPYASR